MLEIEAPIRRRGASHYLTISKALIKNHVLQVGQKMIIVPARNEKKAAVTATLSLQSMFAETLSNRADPRKLSGCVA